MAQPQPAGAINQRRERNLLCLISTGNTGSVSRALRIQRVQSGIVANDTTLTPDFWLNVGLGWDPDELNSVSLVAFHPVPKQAALSTSVFLSEGVTGGVCRLFHVGERERSG